MSNYRYPRSVSLFSVLSNQRTHCCVKTFAKSFSRAFVVVVLHIQLEECRNAGFHWFVLFYLVSYWATMQKTNEMINFGSDNQCLHCACSSSRRRFSGGPAVKCLWTEKIWSWQFCVRLQCHLLRFLHQCGTWWTGRCDDLHEWPGCKSIRHRSVAL